MGIASSDYFFIWELYAGCYSFQGIEPGYHNLSDSFIVGNEIRILHPVDRGLGFDSHDSRYPGNVQSTHERE